MHLLAIISAFHIAHTNMVPTTGALQKCMFRFGHTQVWVWAPCWPVKILQRDPPLGAKLKKCEQTCMQHNSKRWHKERLEESM